jgi:hypothetical protein
VAEDDKPDAGFVPLASLVKGRPGPEAALAEIRRIYFRTSRRTIEHDFAHAIELLKSLPAEDDRGKAAVYMEGLAQMRRDWQRKPRSKGAGPKAGPGGPPTGGREPRKKR